MKTYNLVMKNNLRPPTRTVAKSSLIYEFICPHDECIHRKPHKASYIGETVCTLSRRLTGHLQNGSIKDHFEHCHGMNLTRDILVNNTSIRFMEKDTIRLKILESLVIKFEAPSINSQETGARRVLHLFH